MCHFLEDGYNGVFFFNVSNGFARNLRVQNAGKAGFLVGACSTPEVEGLGLSSATIRLQRLQGQDQTTTLQHSIGTSAFVWAAPPHYNNNKHLRCGNRKGLCVCESYIGKPIGTRAVPQFTTGVAKPLTQIEPGKTEHHPPL